MWSLLKSTLSASEELTVDRGSIVVKNPRDSHLERRMMSKQPTRAKALQQWVGMEAVTAALFSTYRRWLF